MVGQETARQEPLEALMAAASALEKQEQLEGRTGRGGGAVGSGPRYMIRGTLFCTLRESENTRTCENCTRFVQKRATKSDTSGHCLGGSRGGGRGGWAGCVKRGVLG